MHKCRTEVLVFGFLAGLEEDEDTYSSRFILAMYAGRLNNVAEETFLYRESFLPPPVEFLS